MKSIVEEVLSQCPRCPEPKPSTDFYRDKSRKNGLDAYCKQHRQAVAKYEKLLFRYNLTVEDYQRLLKEQNNSCKICKRSTGMHGEVLKLTVDHDHQCCPGEQSCGKCVRGLLCYRCNTTIVPLFENVELVKCVFSYLGVSYEIN